MTPGVDVPQEQPPTPELGTVTMGHLGMRQRDGQHLAAFAGKLNGQRHTYLMPYEQWVAADRPTILTLTITEGLPS